jgi:endonuclease-3
MAKCPGNNQENIKEILELLDQHYGVENTTFLEYQEPYQLLFATMLSAQCTDARVNLVTKDLFCQYPTLEAFAKADLKDMEEAVHSTGFYHNKARNIIACAKALLGEHGGVVPKEIELLTALPGVGRKTANVVRSHIFQEPSIVVDTHVGRIVRHLGLTREKDPVKVEFELMKIIPKDHWITLNRHLITLGRTICPARKPKCEECFLCQNCQDGAAKCKR